MDFYDNYNFEGMKLLSKIQTHKKHNISTPCPEVLQILKLIKQNPTPPLAVAEVGIGFGATALQIVQLLDENDTYYCFDFMDTVTNLIDDFKSGRFDIKCEVIGIGNSHTTYDSYNWNLSNMIFSMRQQKVQGIFDLVYLDGPHNLMHDGLAVCLLKELIKVGGFLVLDDVHWTYSRSTLSSKYAVGKFTKEQMDDKQILRVQELFLSSDPLFEKFSNNKDLRGIFRKIANAPIKL